MPQIPGDKIVQPPSPTEVTISQYKISPTAHEVLAADTHAETAGLQIRHDLSELSDKIQRILPPVHPAGTLLRIVE